MTVIVNGVVMMMKMIVRERQFNTTTLVAQVMSKSTNQENATAVPLTQAAALYKK